MRRRDSATNCRVRSPDTGRNRTKVDPRLKLARLARRPIAEKLCRGAADALDRGQMSGHAPEHDADTRRSDRGHHGERARYVQVG